MATTADHSGHRQRMRSRFRESGKLDGFAEHEIMEMLLFYLIPRVNTNNIAHDLISRFGSVLGVLSASFEQLSDVEGLTENAVVGLKFLSEVSAFSQRQSLESADVRDYFAALSYVGSFFRNEKSECFKVCCINANYRISSITNVSKGSQSSTQVDFRELTRIVLNSGSNAIILAHNHPDASNIPSQEDIILTRQLMKYLRMLDITVLDHYIIGNNGTLSMRNSGFIHDMEC